MNNEKRLFAIAQMQKFIERSRPVYDTEVADWIIDFCEQGGNEEFLEIFVACKFIPLAFYGYLKANNDLEKLRKVVEIVNEKEPTKCPQP